MFIPVILITIVLTKLVLTPGIIIIGAITILIVTAVLIVPVSVLYITIIAAFVILVIKAFDSVIDVALPDFSVSVIIIIGALISVNSGSVSNKTIKY